MFDNKDNLNSEQQLSKHPFADIDDSSFQLMDLTNQKPQTPFNFHQHLQSISEIAPETQRSVIPHIMMTGTQHNPLRSSIDYQEEDEQLYGFVMGTMGTGSAMGMRHIITEDQNIRMHLKGHMQLASTLINPVNNTTTDFLNEDDDNFIPSVSPIQEYYEQHHGIHKFFEECLIVWGRNQMGQLALDPKHQNVIKNPISITLNERMRGQQIEVRQISCGKAHTLILAERNCNNFVFSIGCNKQGQLGIAKAIQFTSEVMLVEGLTKISKIDCSKNSSFAIQSGQAGLCSLYSWGSNKHGILGQSNSSTLKHLLQPEKVSLFQENDKIVQFSAGGNHAAAVIQRMHSDQVYDNLLYVWGSNKYSQLGLGDIQSRDIPTQICIQNKDEEFLTIRNKQVVNVACGDSFTILHTFGEEMYSCGSNMQGQLGLGDSVSTSKVSKFTKLSFYQKEDDSMIKMSASNFSAVLMRSGDVYLWGPTPLGHFNIPKSLQTLQKERNEQKIKVQDISIGQSYGILQDSNRQCFQLGTLFHDNQRIEDSNEFDMKAFNLNQIPGGTFDFFSCGSDFVVASSSGPLMDNIQRSSVRKSQNQSRSVTPGGHFPKKSFNFIEQSIDIQNFGKITQNSQFGGRYGLNNNNPPNLPPSVCSSSLSPLRSSQVICMESTTSRKNDVLNRSANVVPTNHQQVPQAIIQQQLKFLRDSCTPVRDFEPPSHAHLLKTPTALDFYENHQQIAGTEGNYQTIQQSHHDCDFENPHLDKSPQIPTSSAQSNHRQSIQLQSISIPTSTKKQQQLDHHLIATSTLDILIREKQELQHSLNIEIQKRLMAERDLENIQKGQNGQERELKNEIQILKQELQSRQKAAEQEKMSAKHDIDQFQTKNESLTAELEALKEQLNQQAAHLDSYMVQNKSNTSSLEELCSRKAKEIYDLTVQLGCLKEENSQLKRDQDDLKIDFDNRLASQQTRAQEEYNQMLEEYQMYQLHSTQEAERNRIEITQLTQVKDEQASKIYKCDERIKKLNEKVKSSSGYARSKKNSSHLRLDSGIVQSGCGSIVLSSNVANESYVSVSANPHKEENGRKSQDQSFNSFQSKKSRKRDISGNRLPQKENNELSLMVSTTPKCEMNALDTTQRLFNPIETPNDSQKPQQPAVSFDKKQPRQISTLFKKQLQPYPQSANIYQTLSQSMSSIEIIKPVKQQQENPYGEATKKKTLKTNNPATTSLSVLKTSTSRVVNQMNTIQVNVTKSALQSQKEAQKTPTRVLARIDTQSQLKTVNPKHNPQQPSTSSMISVNSKSPMTQKPKHHKSKQASTLSGCITSNNPNNTANFQLNQDESSIFDIQQMAATDELQIKQTMQSSKQQQRRSINNLAIPPQQEMTLGQADQQSGQTPRSQLGDNSFDKQIPQQHHPIRQEKPVLPTSSSTSTLNGCGVIMSEMRNKLIDIQNNKQYIEQKIQEYEKKLVQLKGTSSASSAQTTLLHSSHNSYYPYPNHNSSSYYQDFIMPMRQQQSAAGGGGAGFNNLAAAVNQLTKSSSGLLVLNHSRDSSSRQQRQQ